MKPLLKMKKIYFLFASFIAFNACKQTTEIKGTEQSLVIDQTAKNRLDSTLESFIADSMVVGASALIFEKGKEVYFNAYGYADREAAIPMARNTIVTIYSDDQTCYRNSANDPI